MKKKVLAAASEAIDTRPERPVYRKELEVQVQSIINKSAAKFQSQEQTIERCKYVISELTPLFSEAICNNELSARLAESRMAELVRSLVAQNGPSKNSVSHERKLRRSDEWFKLLREIAIAEKYVRLRRSR